MTIDIMKRFALFVGLCLAQALVFNRIQLFGCAILLIYTYFVITFRRNLPHWASLLSSFCMGLTIDMFSNTPGLTTSALTFMALLQPYVLTLFVPRDADNNVLHTSVAAMGWGKFFPFASFMLFVYCVVFFSLEAFSFFNWQQWLMNIVGSTVLTLIFVMTFERIRK